MDETTEQTETHEPTPLDDILSQGGGEPTGSEPTVETDPEAAQEAQSDPAEVPGEPVTDPAPEAAPDPNQQIMDRLAALEGQNAALIDQLQYAQVPQPDQQEPQDLAEQMLTDPAGFVRNQNAALEARVSVLNARMSHEDYGEKFNLVMKAVESDPGLEQAIINSGDLGEAIYQHGARLAAQTELAPHNGSLKEATDAAYKAGFEAATKGAHSAHEGAPTLSDVPSAGAGTAPPAWRPTPLDKILSAG